MKKIVFYIIFLFLSRAAYTQNMQIAMPYNTSLSEKNITNENGIVMHNYLYESYLGKKEILTFYRKLFENDLKLYRDNSTNDLRLQYFNDKNIYILYFLSNKPNDNRYKLVITGTNNVNDFCADCASFKKTKKYDIIPEYNHGRLIENTEYLGGSLVAIGYITEDKSMDSISFYESRMKNLGWQIINSEDKSGEYIPGEIINIIAPYSDYDITKEISTETAEKKTGISGKTITFKLGIAKCEISVYTLGRDCMELIIKENFGKGMIFHEFGDTIISVAYMPNGAI